MLTQKSHETACSSQVEDEQLEKLRILCALDRIQFELAVYDRRVERPLHGLGKNVFNWLQLIPGSTGSWAIKIAAIADSIEPLIRALRS